MTLVFLHIDRTGGMTVREALVWQYRQDEIRPVPHHRAASWQPQGYPLDYDHDLVSQNVNYVDGGHALVMGHWDVGILDKIPGEKKVLTVLRDPAERAASLWRFIVQEHAMFGSVSVVAARLGMVAFLMENRALWVDAMVNQLSGARWSRTADYDIMKEFGRAVKNLQEFDNVWVTERLSDYPFIQSWQRFTGRERVNESRDDSALSLQFREMVKTLTPMDVELYQIARVRCEIELQQNRVS